MRPAAAALMLSGSAILELSNKRKLEGWYINADRARLLEPRSVHRREM